MIPAYNEARSLRGVLAGIPAGCLTIVVDDGSTDRTAQIAGELGAKIISHERRMGKGASLRDGFYFAKGGIVVTLDGDGQHNPAEIQKVIAPICSGNADMVIGNRFVYLSGRPTGLRTISNRLCSFFVRKICKKKFKDAQCGFRAIHRPFLDRIPIKKNGFEVETEMLIKAVLAGGRILEVPICAKKSGRGSWLGMVDGLRIASYLISTYLASLLPRGSYARAVG